MGAGHNHSEHNHSSASKNKQRLMMAFGLTAFYLIVEVVGGLLTNSLALLADAGHMLTDVAGLGLALLAIKFAERPATPERTYGYYRVEILAALTNAVVLIGISFYIIYEAYQRFFNPPEVQSKGMLLVAVVGLCVNIASMFILKAGSTESLNMKGAYFEVLSDMLTSVGVIIAGIIMLVTGWYYADPIISAGIGLFIFPRTWALLNESIAILLEGTPSDINLALLRETINKIDGVLSCHDLHVWTLTSGINAMTVHVVMENPTSHEQLRKLVQKQIISTFKISHVTVQIEEEGCAESETHI